MTEQPSRFRETPESLALLAEERAKAEAAEAAFTGKRPRCTHCGRRVARNTRSAILHADGAVQDGALRIER